MKCKLGRGAFIFPFFRLVLPPPLLAAPSPCRPLSQLNTKNEHDKEVSFRGLIIYPVALLSVRTLTSDLSLSLAIRKPQNRESMRD